MRLLNCGVYVLSTSDWKFSEHMALAFQAKGFAGICYLANEYIYTREDFLTCCSIEAGVWYHSAQLIASHSNCHSDSWSDELFYSTGFGLVRQLSSELRRKFLRSGRVLIGLGKSQSTSSYSTFDGLLL